MLDSIQTPNSLLHHLRQAKILWEKNFQSLFGDIHFLEKEIQDSLEWQFTGVFLLNCFCINSIP